MDNEQQIAFWNGEAGRRWVENDVQLERSIGPVTGQLLQRAQTSAGMRALDIGCGCGNQTLALARQIGAGGHITGVDISEPMLALARQRAGDAGSDAAGVEFLLADASSHAFAPGSFDLLFSRFGVMFFADPTAAFRNLRQAARPDARLLFSCWQAPALNAWISLPMRVALRHVSAPPKPDPHAPGPFAFADPARIGQILGDAGFGDIECQPWQTALCFAEGDSAEDATRKLVQAGPVGVLLADLTPDAMEAALLEMTEAFAPSFRDGKLMMDSAIWLVSARAVP
jgi:SAM-dependent methyltransferase